MQSEGIDMPFQNTVLDVAGLNVGFIDEGKALHVVRDIDFRLQRSSRTAILGETGCGKSVMAMALFRLLPENASIAGRIHLNGAMDLLQLDPQALRQLRGNTMVLAPQNPMGYLNPVFSVGFHVRETIRRINGLPKQKIGARSLDLLEQVGFGDPEDVAASYPHQLSGGMAQRVLLAISLAGEPALVVADEPTKGLDIHARDHYLALTRELYARAAFLMITHDLAAARSCQRIMIMYAGRIVEEGPATQLLENPQHPYTKGLIAAHPEHGFRAIPGKPPRLSDREAGCAFHSRCDEKSDICRRHLPEVRTIQQCRVRCWHA
jgi:peptide/nickel transport system ATP-binding protein